MHISISAWIDLSFTGPFPFVCQLITVQHRRQLPHLLPLRFHPRRRRRHRRHRRHLAAGHPPPQVRVRDARIIAVTKSFVPSGMPPPSSLPPANVAAAAAAAATSPKPATRPEPLSVQYGTQPGPPPQTWPDPRPFYAGTPPCALGALDNNDNTQLFLSPFMLCVCDVVYSNTRTCTMLLAHTTTPASDPTPPPPPPSPPPPPPSSSSSPTRRRPPPLGPQSLKASKPPGLKLKSKLNRYVRNLVVTEA